MENKQWMVKVINIFSNVIPVEAVDEEEARVKAKEILTNNEIKKDFKHYYDVTLPPENWSVLLKEDFDKLKSDFIAKYGDQPSQTINLLTPDKMKP
jgi:hypothetical protein